MESTHVTREFPLQQYGAGDFAKALSAVNFTGLYSNILDRFCGIWWSIHAAALQGTSSFRSGFKHIFLQISSSLLCCSN
jgi:hypothetical protein